MRIYTRKKFDNHGDTHLQRQLVGCTVSPGFNYNDWKLGDMETLAKTYPQHKSIIEKYTRSILVI